MKEQRELEKQIKEANKFYRAGNPIMEDQGYDALIDLLKQNYPDSKLFKVSILEKAESRKVKLPVPMFSLEKKKSVEEINGWLEGLGIDDDVLLIITPKYDGCSGCYDHGTKKGYTRGDGVEGQNITEHFSHLLDYECNHTPHIAVGEIIMKRSVFERRYKGKYKTARNMVAGVLNREEVDPQVLEDIDFVQYGVGDGLGDKLLQIDSDVPYFAVRRSGITQQLLDDLYKEWSVDYVIDGLVIDINSGDLRKNFGRLPNNNPAYAVAYKNPAWLSNYTTTVLDIEFNISKQGKLKPVIIIEPVDIDGVIVSRVTGYNAKYLLDNNIAKDSEIEIVRSGEVIPKHTKTLFYNSEEVFELMDSLVECPVCGGLVKWDATNTELVCVNQKCEGRLLSKLEHFFSTIGVEDFARPSIEQLYKQGYTTIESILKIRKTDLCNIEGWGETSATNLLNQFDKLKNEGVCLAKKLHALDLFDGVLGEKTIQLILDNLGMELPTVSVLCGIKGVAETTAKAFMTGFNMYTLLGHHHLPIRTTYVETPKKEAVGDSCKGMKVCFTGVRSQQAEDLITSNSGEVVSGVSKTTTHLIVKDMSDDVLKSGKAVKAKSLEIEIISLEDFLNKF